MQTLENGSSSLGKKISIYYKHVNAKYWGKEEYLDLILIFRSPPYSLIFSSNFFFFAFIVNTQKISIDSSGMGLYFRSISIPHILCTNKICRGNREPSILC